MINCIWISTSKSCFFDRFKFVLPKLNFLKFKFVLQVPPDFQKIFDNFVDKIVFPRTRRTLQRSYYDYKDPQANLKKGQKDVFGHFRCPKFFFGLVGVKWTL